MTVKKVIHSVPENSKTMRKTKKKFENIPRADMFYFVSSSFKKYKKHFLISLIHLYYYEEQINRKISHRFVLIDHAFLQVFANLNGKIFPDFFHPSWR